MPVEGLMFIAGQPVAGNGASFAAVEASSGQPLAPQFATASAQQVEQAVAAAAAAAPAMAASQPDRKSVV